MSSPGDQDSQQSRQPPALGALSALALGLPEKIHDTWSHSNVY